MLIIAADRGVETFGQRLRRVDAARQNDAGAVQDHRELGVRQQLRRGGDRLAAAGLALKPDDLRQIDIDHLRPEIPRDVDLRRRRAAMRLFNHAVQHFSHARRIANLLLIADDVGEQAHLLHFLKAALTDRLVRRLRGHQQHRRVVPIGGFDRRHEVGDAGAVLGDRHAHLARRAGVAVGAHAGVALMRAVPELDAGFRKQIRNRHHRRTDNAERMLDTMHLKHFDEGFFRRHLHNR